MVHVRLRRVLTVDREKYGSLFVEYKGRPYSLDNVYNWAIEGRSGAISTLARLYFYGEIIEKERSFAIQLLESLISREPSVDGGVYYNLASYCLEEERYDRALELFETLVNRQNAKGIYAFSMIYHNGVGVEQNETKFLHYLQKSAGLGYVSSPHFMYQFDLEFLG